MSYGYALTFHVWPIEGEICLSEKFGYYLKNPDENQISNIIKILRSNIKSVHQVDGMGNLDDSIKDYLKEFRLIYREFEELYKIKFKGKITNLFDIVARNLVIIKIDKSADDIGYKAIRKEDDIFEYQDESVFDILNAYISIIDLYNGLFKSHYANSLSMMIKDDIYSTPNHRNFVWITMINLVVSITSSKTDFEDDETSRFIHPKLALDDIVHTASKLERHDITQNIDKMFGLGSMIYAGFSEIKNYDLKILLLTSILEALTVRNPDTSRFNVDDSINKQFQLKSALLLNKADPNIDLQDTRKFLKLMYGYRSSIAHGSYAEARKLLRANKTDLLSLEHEAGLILSKCFTVYVDHFDFADFLKES